MGIFDIVSIDVRLILLNFAATNVYELFTKSVKKICNLNAQNERIIYIILLSDLENLLSVWENTLSITNVT